MQHLGDDCPVCETGFIQFAARGKGAVTHLVCSNLGCEWERELTEQEKQDFADTDGVSKETLTAYVKETIAELEESAKHMHENPMTCGSEKEIACYMKRGALRELAKHFGIEVDDD
jgi:hypothetical protein